MDARDSPRHSLTILLAVGNETLPLARRASEGLLSFLQCRAFTRVPLACALARRANKTYRITPLNVYQIKHSLERMVQFAGNDGAIATGVADFLEEAEWNLARIAKKARYTLPQLPPDGNRLVRVETPETDDESEPLLLNA